MDIISWIYGKIIIPSAYYLRGDSRYYYFGKYKANLTKSRKEIQKQQLVDLIKLIKHSYNTVPYYKKLFDSIGFLPEQITKIEDIKKIPPLTKEIIKDNLEDLKSLKKYSMDKCYSGGSTGNRVMIYQDKRFKQISRAVVLRDLYNVGINPGDKVAWVWSAPFDNESLKKSFKDKMLWYINRRIIFNALNYNDAELEKWLRYKFNKFKPRYIYGYANAIYDIAKFIKDNNIKIHQVDKIICSAQKLEHREYIEKVFNCKVIDQYGCREVNSIAIEDDDYVMHSSDDFVIAEVDKEDKILLTPLESYGMPLIRYEVGDVGFRNKTIKNDDYLFNRFTLSIGRSVEILRDSNGKKIHSAKINLEIAKNSLDIGEFQLIQNSIDEVVLNIVKTKNTNKKDIDKMKQIIKNALGTKTIHIKFLEKFPLEKSGKKIGYKCMIKDKPGVQRE